MSGPGGGSGFEPSNTNTPELTISDGTIFIKEQSNADADKSGYGQIWVKTGSPGDLYYTNESGNDVRITSGVELAAGGSGTSVAADDINAGNASVSISTTSGNITLVNSLTASDGLLIPDDITLRFGAAAGDATIEYDENGTDELRFAGAAVTFEQDVTFDNDVTLGVAATDVTTVTGQLTASNGMEVTGTLYVFHPTDPQLSLACEVGDGADRGVTFSIQPAITAGLIVEQFDDSTAYVGNHIIQKSSNSHCSYNVVGGGINTSTHVAMKTSETDESRNWYWVRHKNTDSDNPDGMSFRQDLQYPLQINSGSLTDTLVLTTTGITVTGDATFKGDILTNVLGTSNTVFGKLAGAAIEADGNYNLLMGENAGNDLTTGDDNVIIGYNTAVVATTMSDLVVIGSGAGVALAAGSTLADGTVLVGKSAGAAITTGQYNTAIGHTALLLEDVGDFNTAVGYNALASQTGGNSPNSNTAIGAAAGDAVTTGIKNVFVGKDAGGSTQLVDGTVCIGYGAGADVMTADADGTVAIGLDAGSSLTVGQYQTAIGYAALAVNIVGDGNTAIGYGTLAAAVSADGDGNNTAVGASAGGYVGTGVGNTAIGANAMLGDYATGGGTNDIDGNNNTCVGAAAGMVMITTAHSNTFIGAYAGDDTTTGYENTCIGVSCDAQDATAHNQIVIGNNMNGTADNAVHIGNDTSHIRCDFNSDETWDASSDRRQKKDIECIDIGLDFINDLNPVKYRHKSPSEFPQEWTAYNPEDTTPMGGSNKYHWGFIAQEVKEVVDKYNVPDHNSWSVDPDGRQRVSKSSMTTILVKAVQELSAKVAELEAKLENQ